MEGAARSIAIIESLLLISFLGGIRLLWRILRETIRVKEGRRVLIIGAGDAGEMIVREMRKSVDYDPVGFVDSDPRKLGLTIHGVTVLGTPDQLPQLLAKTQPRRCFSRFRRPLPASFGRWSVTSSRSSCTSPLSPACISWCTARSALLRSGRLRSKICCRGVR